MKSTLLFIQFLIVLLLIQEKAALAQNEEVFNTPSKVQGDVAEVVLNTSLDTYFHHAIGTIEDAPRTSFANLPGFSLGMIDVVASYDARKGGVVVNLVFGPRGSDAIFNSSIYVNPTGNGSSHIINQMYAYYNFSDNFSVHFGQFNTFLGYEAISPIPNFHYSTSYLFSYGPFNHTGLRADLDLGNGWAGKLAIMNPTDFTEYNPLGTYTIGGQLGYSSKVGDIYLSAIFGDNDGRLKSTDTINSISAGKDFQMDLTARYNFSEKYFVGINASYRTIGTGELLTANGTKDLTGDPNGFYGIAIYQKYTFNESIAIGLRAESFNEFEEGVGAIGGYNTLGNSSITEVTLTGNLIKGNLRVIPEFRMDMGSIKSFTNDSTGEAIDTMPSFNIAVVYDVPIIKFKVPSLK